MKLIIFLVLTCSSINAQSVVVGGFIPHLPHLITGKISGGSQRTCEEDRDIILCKSSDGIMCNMGFFNKDLTVYEYVRKAGFNTIYRREVENSYGTFKDSYLIKLEVGND